MAPRDSSSSVKGERVWGPAVRPIRILFISTEDKILAAEYEYYSS